MTNISPFCPKAVLHALKAASDPKAFIANELRDMAAGRKEYGSLHVPTLPPWCRHVWLAAAEMLVNEETR
jgi:hypothetical protein